MTHIEGSQYGRDEQETHGNQTRDDMISEAKMLGVETDMLATGEDNQQLDDKYLQIKYMDGDNQVLDSQRQVTFEDD